MQSIEENCELENISNPSPLIPRNFVQTMESATSFVSCESKKVGEIIPEDPDDEPEEAKTRTIEESLMSPATENE